MGLLVNKDTVYEDGIYRKVKDEAKKPTKTAQVPQNTESRQLKGSEEKKPHKAKESGKGSKPAAKKSDKKK